MHTHTLDAWRHDHAFLGARHDKNERRTWMVVGLTATMMVVEIIGGAIFGSMALVADGWHMSSHAGALAIGALAYRFARRHARNERFAFGTGKVGELAGFSSALVLAMIALLIGYESSLRLLNPVPISFDQAIAIAVVGLAVNLGSAWLLRDEHGHHHSHDGHEHDHDHHHHAHDHNLRAAYLHVLADALTSVLAIMQSSVPATHSGPTRCGAGSPVGSLVHQRGRARAVHIPPVPRPPAPTRTRRGARHRSRAAAGSMG